MHSEELAHEAIVLHNLALVDIVHETDAHERVVRAHVMNHDHFAVCLGHIESIQVFTFLHLCVVGLHLLQSRILNVILCTEGGFCAQTFRGLLYLVELAMRLQDLIPQLFSFVRIADQSLNSCLLSILWAKVIPVNLGYV